MSDELEIPYRDEDHAFHRRLRPTRRKRDYTLIAVVLAAGLSAGGWGALQTARAIDARYVHVAEWRARRDTVSRQRVIDSMIFSEYMRGERAHDVTVDSALVDIRHCLHRPDSCR